MTTENQSVLEKLKRYADDLEDLNKIEGFGTARSEWEDVRAYSRCHFEIHILPRLIAALELVEAKAKETRTVKSGYLDAKIDLARELIELINGVSREFNRNHSLFIFINALIIVTVFGAVAIKNNDSREIRAVVNGETKGE